MTNIIDAENRIVPMDRIPGLVLPDLVRFMCEESVAFDEETSPFRARMQAGDARLVVVVGQNASGKSIMHKMVAGIAHAHGIEPISLSIRERTGSNESPGSMRRQFMYGSEHLDSTGNTTLRTTMKAFDTLEKRTAAAMVLLDEPEQGLSEGFAHAFGELIGRRAATPGPVACGTMVISHSRALVRGLRAGLGSPPGFVVTGDGPDTMDEWLNADETRTVDELLALADLSSERRAAARALLGI